MPTLLKKSSAWLPLAMSLAALVILVGYVAMFGVVQPQPGADEGAAARVFQLLMAAQVPIVGFFAVRWLPERPWQGLQVLVLQFAAALAPVGLILFLEK